MIDKTIYIVEMTAYDPSGPSLLTLRYASGNGFVTSPTDYPASTFYDARLMQPVDITRSIFGNGTLSGRSQVGFGDVKLNNGDGALDALLTYGFDGRDIIVRRGNVGTSFPLSFETVFRGTMEQPETDGDSIRIRVREKTFDFRLPLQETRYDGDNVLPDGLEGLASDIKGAVKPLVYGKVRNISPVLVNTARLIYQLSDGPLQAVNNVYDSGISLNEAPKEWETGGTTGAGQSLYIAYGDGVYIYVTSGTPGSVYTSSTAASGSWTSRTHNHTGTIRGVAYGNGYFVTVGDGGVIDYSSDGGVTWTAATSGVASVLRGVFYSPRLGLWVAFGESAVLLTATTPSGTWTSRTSGFTADSIRAGCETDTTLVVVGAAGKIATSTDGTTWTARNSSNDANFSTVLNGVAYASGLTRAVGDAGIVIRSRDGGVTWQREAITFDGLAGGATVTLYGVASYDGHWIIGGQTSNLAVTTGDSETWTRFKNQVAGAGCFAVAYGGGRWVIAGGGQQCRTAARTFYASLAELEDDALAPKPGQWRAYLAGGYVRLGSLPAGLITADAVSGSSTVASALLAILQKAGYDRTPNLVTAPEDWSNAAWGKTNITVTTDAITAPDVTTTADKLEATAAGATNLYQNLGAWNERAITYTCYVKKGSGATDANRFTLWNATAGSTVIFVTVNYDTGAIVSSTGAGLASGSLTFTSVGGGWYRLRLTATEGWTPGDSLRIYSCFDGAVETANEYAYAWGAHVAATMDEPMYTYFNVQDLSAIDNITAPPMTMGLFINESMSIETAITSVASSIGAWWGTDRLGQIRFKQLTAPSGSPVIELTASDIIGQLNRLPFADGISALPSYRTMLRYDRNYSIQESGLAFGVSEAHRIAVQREWREESYAQASVQTTHLLAQDITEESLLTETAEVLTEVTRRQTLRGVRRDRFQLTLALDSVTNALDLGDVIRITHSRYGLGSGKLFRIISVAPNAAQRQVTLNVWG